MVVFCIVVHLHNYVNLCSGMPAFIECPFLGHEFGATYSMGYQDDEGTGVLKALATPKHFDVFNGPGDGGGMPVTGVTI
jgi:hypothetical protein